MTDRTVMLRLVGLFREKGHYCSGSYFSVFSVPWQIKLIFLKFGRYHYANIYGQQHISLINYLIPELTQIRTQDALSTSILISSTSPPQGYPAGREVEINGPMEAAPTQVWSGTRCVKGRPCFIINSKSTMFRVPRKGKQHVKVMS